MALDPEAIPLPTIVVSPANVPDDKALAPTVGDDGSAGTGEANAMDT